jgi:hypothetical protein
VDWRNWVDTKGSEKKFAEVAKENGLLMVYGSTLGRKEVAGLRARQQVDVLHQTTTTIAMDEWHR